MQKAYQITTGYHMQPLGIAFTNKEIAIRFAEMYDETEENVIQCDVDNEEYIEYINAAKGKVLFHSFKSLNTHSWVTTVASPQCAGDIDSWSMKHFDGVFEWDGEFYIWSDDEGAARVALHNELAKRGLI